MTTTSGLTASRTGASLGHLAEVALERTGGTAVLVFEEQRWTAAELAARARRFAGGLREAGLATGDRVVVCMANCPEVGIVYQAVWRAGGVVTPVLFLLSEDELHHVLSDSGAVLVVTTPEFSAKVVAAARGISSVRGVVVASDDGALGVVSQPGDAPLLPYADLEQADELPLVEVASSSMAALLYTGGTTGRAKGVVLTHDALSAGAWAAQASRTEDGQTGLLPLPMSHVYGLTLSVMNLHSVDPGNAVLMRWFDPTGFLTLVAEHQVQISALVPSMLRMLLTAPIEDYDTSSLVRVATGSAPLPREVAEQFMRRIPTCEVFEGYGCTESSAMVTVTPAGKAKIGSVGLPAVGVEVRIELPDGTDALTGADGEICVRGPNLMSGYWHSDEATAVALRGGWLHTGDVGHFDADGYLFIVDRIKDLIIRNGFNVYPRDVEDVMSSRPDVVNCGVVGRPDAATGEEVVAFVQLKPGATATPAELVAFAKSRMSAAKYPRDVRVVDAIPVTSMLKTDRKALRSMASDTSAP